MLPPSQSPVHKLVSLWRKSRPLCLHEVNTARAAIYTAAVHEISANSNAGHVYDPAADARFRWACEWINVADGSCPSISDDTEFLATYLMDPKPTIESFKHAAAHDIS